MNVHQPQAKARTLDRLPQRFDDRPFRDPQRCRAESRDGEIASIPTPARFSRASERSATLQYQQEQRERRR